MPWWPSLLSIQLLILAQVMIPGLCNRASTWVPCWAWSLLGILSLCPFPADALSLKKNFLNKELKKRKKTKATDITKCWQGYGATGTLMQCRWECKMVQPLWKTVWHCLTKVNTCSSYDSAVSLLGIYPGRVKEYIHTKIRVVDVRSSIIHNYQKFEMTPMSFQWGNGQTDWGTFTL